MTMHSKMVISCGALIVAVAAGMIVTPSAEEPDATFGRDLITMRAMVAKNPAAMRDGASSVYRYRREDDRLTLTEIRTPAGPSSQPIVVTLRRIE